MQPKYKRILLKLSGESLAGGDKHGINNETVLSIGRAIKACADMGVEIRSEERRVGKECRIGCRSRWSPDH